MLVLRLSTLTNKGVSHDKQNVSFSLSLSCVILFVVPMTATAQMDEVVEVAAEEVEIPDANLRAAIEAHLPPSEGPITTLDMANLTSLVVDGYRNKILNLTGLEHAINLKRLTLINNDISDISLLADLTNLEHLGLSSNDISDISPLADLTNLETLWLSSNDISDISPLADLTNLENLELAFNDISDISPLASLTNLKFLHLGLNPISNISALSELTGLTSLSFFGNDSVLDFSPLSKLTNTRWLDLRRTAIEDVSFLVENSGVDEEDVINLTNNPLNSTSVSVHIPALERRGVQVMFGVVSDINLRRVLEELLDKKGDIITADNLVTLTVLDAPDSDINSLRGLEHATNLKELTLNGNRLSGFELLNPLSRMAKIEVLKIDDNNISFLPLQILPPQNLTNLKELSVRHNNISDITSLSRLTTLETLRLRGNSISDISALSALTNLKSLSVSGNPIEDVTPISGLTELRYLWVQEIPITDISFVENLTNLQSLYLRKNTISDISPLTQLTKLKRLGLNDNRIVDIAPLVAIASLRGSNAHVDLSGNPLNSESVDVHIPALKDRGVTVVFEPIQPIELPDNPEDINRDGTIDIQDLSLVVAVIAELPLAFFAINVDVNGDGVVNTLDMLAVVKAADVNVDGVINIDDAIAVANAIKNADDAAAAPQILASFLPRETTLLANYPNPFNPETWLPYHLAEAANVQISIYNTAGALIRQLDIGHQSAGFYTDKGSAAYWDGRNEQGGAVASGVYFYQLRAGNYSQMRRMLVVK